MFQDTGSHCACNPTYLFQIPINVIVAASIYALIDNNEFKIPLWLIKLFCF